MLETWLLCLELLKFQEEIILNKILSNPTSRKCKIKRKYLKAWPHTPA